MKRLIFALFSLSFVLLSCKDADNKDSGNNNASSTTAQTNAAHSREIYRAIETGDVSKLDSFVAVDMVDHEGDAMGNTTNGLANLKTRLADIHNHFDNLKCDLVSDATSDNGYHFTLVHMTGTAKDASMGMPAGTKMDRSGVDVVMIKDGKAAEHWSFEDPKAMMEMMKHMPQGDGKMDPKKNPMDSTSKM